MGVAYKLTDKIGEFILFERQNNVNLSCRELSERVQGRFGVTVSKSTVHWVLKEAHVAIPRGRKPKDKFQIPSAKKQQISANIAQAGKGLVLPSVSTPLIPLPLREGLGEGVIEGSPMSPPPLPSPPHKGEGTRSLIYDRAGEIFLKAGLWDLGIYDDKGLSGADWQYYTTYTKGVKIFCDGQEHFIQLVLPIQRCINYVMDAITGKGAKKVNVSIVGQNDHNLAEFELFGEYNNDILSIFNDKVVCIENNSVARTKTLFFPQATQETIDQILALSGFTQENSHEYAVTLIIPEGYKNKEVLDKAIQKLNNAKITDPKRRVIKLFSSSG